MEQVRTLIHVVAELDCRVVAYGEQVCRKLSLPVRWVHHDLRAPLPAALRGNFSGLFLAPPYPLAGMKLFLLRGLEGLCDAGGCPIFLSMGSTSGCGCRSSTGSWGRR